MLPVCEGALSVAGEYRAAALYLRMVPRPTHKMLLRPPKNILRYCFNEDHNDIFTHPSHSFSHSVLYMLESLTI